MASQSSIALSCDDAYISLIYSITDDHSSENHEDPNHHQNLISDDKYAHELQLQEAIMASLNALISPSNRANVSMETGEPSGANRHEKSLGESSTSFCEICTERKDMDEMFAVENCTHRYCAECISKHVTIKLQKQKMAMTGQSGGDHHINRSITCPGIDCQGVIEIEKCREIISIKDVVTTWDDVICESMIDPKHRFFCPYKDCSGLLVNDSAEVVIREAECPFCKRLFCAQCGVPWHGEVESCEEFLSTKNDQRGRELDVMVHELAKEKKWQRCPHCKIFVERNEGCLHMTCRCGHQFCYGCGATWSSTHASCQ